VPVVIFMIRIFCILTRELVIEVPLVLIFFFVVDQVQVENSVSVGTAWRDIDRFSNYGLL